MPDRTRNFRRALAVVRLSTLAEYRRLWALLDTSRLDETFPGFAVAVARLVGQQRTTAGALTRAYLADQRAAAGIAGAPPSVSTPALEAGLLATSLAVTSAVSVKRAMLRGDPLPAASDRAFVASAGSVTRMVENASRDTVRASVNADDAAAGWTRITSGDACTFCSGLADGSVLPGSVEMAAHDTCACSAQPVYR